MVADLDRLAAVMARHKPAWKPVTRQASHGLTCENVPLGSSARSFGAPGAGGSLGFADPDVGVGYGYVTSHMGMTFSGDPRDVALRKALYSAL